METQRPRSAEGSREDREAKKIHHYIHLHVIKSHESIHFGNGIHSYLCGND